MGFASLPESFWGYALETACLLLNNVPNKSVNKTPYEIWTGRKPTFSHLRVWGCSAYVMRLETDKLGQRSDKCLFVGYPKEFKGYYFYLPEEQKLFIRLRAIFLEKEFLSEGTIASKIELNEVQQQKEPVHTQTTIESDLIRSNPEPIVQPSRRSGRVPHPLDRYYGYLVQDGDPVELDENNEDPITYMDAMQRSDFELWLGAMKSEMESMEINHV